MVDRPGGLYLRDAANFDQGSARMKALADGAVRWGRSNGQFLIERDGKIASYGYNQK